MSQSRKKEVVIGMCEGGKVKLNSRHSNKNNFPKLHKVVPSAIFFIISMPN